MKKVKISVPINNLPDNLYNLMRDAIETEANKQNIDYYQMEDEEWVFTCEGYVPEENSIDFINKNE